MKWCSNCNHVTPGEPLFCNFCGRSYSVKLCPRHHVNPRNAEACSQCGSFDLSTPAPRVPFWAPTLEFLLSLIPGSVLTFLSILFAIAILKAVISYPELLLRLMVLAIPFGVLWWMWSELPEWFRSAIYKLIKRRRDRKERSRS